MVKKVKLKAIDPLGYVAYEKEFSYVDSPKEKDERSDAHFRYFLVCGL